MSNDNKQWLKRETDKLRNAKLQQINDSYQPDSFKRKIRHKYTEEDINQLSTMDGVIVHHLSIRNTITLLDHFSRFIHNHINGNLPPVNEQLRNYYLKYESWLDDLKNEVQDRNELIKK